MNTNVNKYHRFWASVLVALCLGIATTIPIANWALAHHHNSEVSSPAVSPELAGPQGSGGNG